MNFTYVTHRLEIAFWQATIPLLKKRQLLRKRQPKRFLWLALVGCLALVAAAWYSFPHARPNLPGVFGDPVEKGNQSALLVVVVDQLPGLTPLLKGVWRISILTEQSHWKIVPVFPASLGGGEEIDARLVQSFSLGRNGSLSSEFRHLLHEPKLDLSWDSVVVMDEFALAGLTDQLGSVAIGQHSCCMGTLDSSQAIAQIFSPQLSPQMAKQRQTDLFSSLCRQSIALFRDVDPLVVLERFSRHVYTDHPNKLWVEQWYRMRDYGRGLVCEFPTQQSAPDRIQP